VLEKNQKSSLGRIFDVEILFYLYYLIFYQKPPRLLSNKSRLNNKLAERFKSNFLITFSIFKLYCIIAKKNYFVKSIIEQG